MASTYQRSMDVGACKLAIPTAVVRKILVPRRGFCAPYRVRRACATGLHTGDEISVRPPRGSRLSTRRPAPSPTIRWRSCVEPECSHSRVALGGGQSHWLRLQGRSPTPPCNGTATAPKPCVLRLRRRPRSCFPAAVDGVRPGRPRLLGR